MTISWRRWTTVVLAPRILRSLADQARGAVEHSHGPDHVEVSEAACRTSPWLLVSAAADRASGPSVSEVAGKPEAKQEKRAEQRHHSQQRMHEEKNAEEERRPERVKQQSGMRPDSSETDAGS